MSRIEKKQKSKFKLTQKGKLKTQIQKVKTRKKRIIYIIGYILRFMYRLFFLKQDSNFQNNCTGVCILKFNFLQFKIDIYLRIKKRQHI
jgi:hypothetical protein